MYPTDIVSLNRDLEPFLIQGASKRCRFFKDPYEPLQFVHCSDAHAVADPWNRMVEYVNYYKDYISFILHTGDYCGGSQEQYVDFYGTCAPCQRPIYNCVGNHDTFTNMPSPDRPRRKSDQATVYRMLFNHPDDWDVVLPDTPYPTYYYKDFPQSNLRLIVLDCYYDLSEQIAWLAALLSEAKQKGLHVITAMHEPSDQTVIRPDTTFQTIIPYEEICKDAPKSPFEDTLSDFVREGGILVCNLAGHDHHDGFGYTAGGVLNSIVECATYWAGWCDGARVKGTRTYDCFNVCSVDANLGILKIIRVGDNCDPYLRAKRVLCYDYVNKKVIFNG
ncbi:MAG: metallophosphoesterase [Clostridia bacterium]|nr:metallophosphoesterase [Clostridia bacterium]